jgi:hypothetical protein
MTAGRPASPQVDRLGESDEHAVHLPARRSRQNVNLFLRRPVTQFSKSVSKI